MKYFLHGISLVLFTLSLWIMLSIRSECFSIGADSIGTVVTIYTIYLAVFALAYFIWSFYDD